MSPRYRLRQYGVYAQKKPVGAVWYYWYYNADGKRVRCSTGIGYEREKDKAKTRREAEDYCAALHRAGRLGKAPEGVTLAGWIESMHFWDWSRSRYVRGILARSPVGKPGIKENSVKDAGSICAARILPHHGGLLIEAVTPRDCEDLLFQWKDSGSKAKTVNNWRSVYSAMLSEAERLGVIPSNPWKHVPQLATDPVKRGGLTVDEGRRVISSDGVNLADHGERIYYLAVKTAFLTGLRIAEVIGLKTDDVRSRTIDRDGASVTVYYLDVSQQYNRKLKRQTTVKDSTARAIPIMPQLYEDIEPLLTGKDRYLFSFDPKQRTPITDGRLRDWFYARLESLGIERRERNIVFHSSRKFANSLLRRYVPDHVLRKMTGHDSDAMTEHYTDYLPEDLAAIAEAQQTVAERSQE